MITEIISRIRKKDKKKFFGMTEILIDNNCIGNVIDVGANRGQFAEKLKKIGYKGIIHSIEPLSSEYAVLTQRANKHKNWFCHKIAAGDKTSKEKINITESSDFSSILEPNGYSDKKFHNKARVIGTEQVDVCTLDEYQSKLMPYDDNKGLMIKIDTQGYEMNVIKGAAMLLEKTDVLAVEVSMKAIYEKMTNYIQLVDYLNNCGFDIVGMYPVSRDEDTMALIEADCLFVRKDRER